MLADALFTQIMMTLCSALISNTEKLGASTNTWDLCNFVNETQIPILIIPSIFFEFLQGEGVENV